MSTNKLVGSISIPTYTNEELRVRTKFKMNIPLTKTDNYTLALDIIKFKKSKVIPSFTDPELSLYLDKKYPNWMVEELLSTLNDMVKD